MSHFESSDTYLLKSIHKTKLRVKFHDPFHWQGTAFVPGNPERQDKFRYWLCVPAAPTGDTIFSQLIQK